jgi:hypothetical protein
MRHQDTFVAILFAKLKDCEVTVVSNSVYLENATREASMVFEMSSSE